MAIVTMYIVLMFWIHKKSLRVLSHPGFPCEQKLGHNIKIDYYFLNLPRISEMRSELKVT